MFGNTNCSVSNCLYFAVLGRLVCREIYDGSKIFNSFRTMYTMLNIVYIKYLVKDTCI